MKPTTPVFLFLMLHFLFAPALRPKGNKKRIRELKVEQKTLKRELNKLNSHIAAQNRLLKRISFNASKPELNNTPSIIPRLDTTGLNHKTCKDTLCLLMQIQTLQAVVEGKQATCLANETKIQAMLTAKGAVENLKQLQKGSNQILKFKNLRNQSIQGRLKSKQTDLLKQIQNKQFSKQLENAKAQQSKLLIQMKQPGFAFPTGMQTKETIKENLPWNQTGMDPEKAGRMKEKFENGVKDYNTNFDSTKITIAFDSIKYKPNPYRQLPFFKRFEPTFGWQAQKPNFYYPARIEWLPGLVFLWRPKLKPTIALNVRTGFGEDIQHIKLSFQGIGIRAGIDACIFKKLNLFGAYDYSTFPAISNETGNAFDIKPALIIGLKLQSTIQIYVGYNVMNKQYPERGNPFIVQFNFQP